jgi:acetylornithine deacetylase/succinyl-diaminopimelate desuccinylase-like protein
VKNRSLTLFAIGLALLALAAMERAVAGDEALEQEALSLLTQYLRIDTTNPPGNEIRAAEFFKSIFDREGIESQIFESAPGRGNVYARIKGDGSKKAVVLPSHMDVDPVAQQFFADIADLDPVPAKREKLKNLREALKDPAFAADFTKDLRNNATVRNTISITMLEGSNKVNVIPAEASAQLDVRLLPTQDPALFLNDLRQVIADDEIRIEIVLSFAPGASSVDTEFFAVLRGIAGEIDPGVKVTTPLLTGFTDCHFFREKGIPCYGFIPFRLPAKELGGVHGNDERVSLDNVKFGTRTMVEIVRRLATQ